MLEENKKQLSKYDYPDLSNEKVLFIYNKFTGMAPYSHEFILGGLDPQILSGFISAMSSFMGEVTGDEHSRWKTSYGSGHDFLVEGGEWATGVLAVSRETNEVRSKLRRIVEEFEESFECLKEADTIDGRLFVDFDHFVRCTFINDRLSERSLIIKRSNWNIPKEYELPSIGFKVARFLHLALNGQSLSNVSKQTRLSIEAVKDFTSRALWKKAIFVKYIPNDQDIISLSENASSVLFLKDNPLDLDSQTVKVLTGLDGRKPLSEFLDSLKDNSIDEVLQQLGYLINQGYIQKISIEKRLVLINECVLNELILEYVTTNGTEAARDVLLAAIENGLFKHPWIGRLRVTNDMAIYSVLDETMTPTDLDQMYYAIEFAIQYFRNQMEKIVGQLEAEELLQAARELCHKKWSEIIRNIPD